MILVRIITLVGLCLGESHDLGGSCELSGSHVLVGLEV